MIPLLKRLLKPKDDTREKFFEGIQQISTLSDEVEKTKKSLEGAEYSILTEHADDTYISLADFLEMVDDPELSLSKIISKCVHTVEIQEREVSAIEVFAIVDGSHIVLCKDVSTCEEHKHYLGNKVRILTARRIS